MFCPVSFYVPLCTFCIHIEVSQQKSQPLQINERSLNRKPYIKRSGSNRILYQKLHTSPQGCRHSKTLGGGSLTGSKVRKEGYGERGSEM